MIMAMLIMQQRMIRELAQQRGIPGPAAGTDRVSAIPVPLPEKQAL
jgi:hypothetical protein